jgi:hypothetical protein
MMKLIIAVAALVMLVWAAVGVKWFLENRQETVELDSRVTFDGAVGKQGADLKQWEVRTLNYAVSKNEDLIKRISVIIEQKHPERELTGNSTLSLEMFLRLMNGSSVEIPKRQIRRNQLADMVYRQTESQMKSYEDLSKRPELRDKNITRIIN